jgi:hypothetical protein
MPRTATTSVRITITTTRGVHDHLKRLLPMGLYGSSVAEVAERLLCEALRKDTASSRQRLLNPPMEVVK